MLYYIGIPSSVCPLASRWIFELFLVLGYYEQSYYKLSSRGFIWSNVFIFLDFRLIGTMSFFIRNCLFSKCLYHFAFARVIDEFQLFLVLVNIWYCQFFQAEPFCCMYINMVLIYISPKTNDVERLFMYLFAIHLSPLVKCLLKSFVHF